MDEPRVQWEKLDSGSEADLAVVIVSWNVRDHLVKNLEHLGQSAGTIRAQCLVIDNASSDGTVKAVQTAFPWVTMIANTENKGFAAANNQGLAKMHARHALLLNPDMFVESHALERLVRYLDAHADVGVLGGRLLTERGATFPSVRRFPGAWSQAAILLKLPHLFSRMLDHYLWHDFDYNTEQPAEVVRGSFFAIHHLALQRFGGLDERYFLWFEEVDYCKQVTQGALRVMYAPSIQATDLVGKSFSQTPRYLAQKRFTRSLLQYFQKWHPAWQFWFLCMLRPFGLALAWLIDQWMALHHTSRYHQART